MGGVNSQSTPTHNGGFTTPKTDNDSGVEWVKQCWGTYGVPGMERKNEWQRKIRQYIHLVVMVEILLYNEFSRK